MKLLLVSPWALVMAGFVFVVRAADSLRDRAVYLRQREFWGGAQEEVFSHWLDMVVMSGSAFALAGIVCFEAFARRAGAADEEADGFTRAAAVAGCAVTAVAAAVLDSRYGEGTLLFAYLIVFMPMLAASYYLLRRTAAAVAWSTGIVVILSLGYAIVQLGAQLYYEPSETGGPDGTVFIFWLVYVGGALAVGSLRKLRAGEVQRFFARAATTARNPILWASLLALLLAIGVPLTLRAHRVHSAREQFAIRWLDEVEARLSDEVVATLKAHAGEHGERYVKLPIPAAADALLKDPRISAGNSLRIYVPLGSTDYLFLWANDAFSYCDVRPLSTADGQDIDLPFIDSLLARGGTQQTGFYSVLLSPYIAGRLLKNASGSPKAICVVDTADRSNVAAGEPVAITEGAAQPH
jgi:hypothetical protein